MLRQFFVGTIFFHFQIGKDLDHIECIDSIQNDTENRKGYILTYIVQK